MDVSFPQKCGAYQDVVFSATIHYIKVVAVEGSDTLERPASAVKDESSAVQSSANFPNVVGQVTIH